MSPETICEGEVNGDGFSRLKTAAGPGNELWEKASGMDEGIVLTERSV